MKYNPDNHNRKSIRLKGYDYSTAGGYFVTICVKDRQCLFGEIKNGEMVLSEIGQVAYDNWLDIPKHFSNVDIDEFVLMPNHFHGIILINPGNKDNREIFGSIHGADENNIGNVSSGLGLMNQTPAINGLKSIKNLSSKITGTNISDEYNLMLNPNLILGKIIRHYKAKTTRIIHKNKFGNFQWQRNYHEWIIRDEKHLDKFRNYIYHNPLKWEIDSENPDKKHSKINPEENTNHDQPGRGLIHQTQNTQSKITINQGTKK